MYTSAVGASSTSSALIRLLCAAGAAYCAIGLSAELLARWTIARFWEPWLRWIGPLWIGPFSALPLILVALTSGLIFGFVLGLVFRAYPTRVASFAGLLAAVFMLTAGASVALLASSGALVIGFVSGGAAGGRITRA
jgi:hypothetical protein